MISTNIGLAVEKHRSGGVEFGRLTNDWLDCRFEIRPMLSNRGFNWTVFYKATDTASDAGGFPAVDTFRGSAATRNFAAAQMFDVVTKRINAVVRARESYIKRQRIYAKISIEAGLEVPSLSVGAPMLLGHLDGQQVVMPNFLLGPASPTSFPRS